MTIHLQNNNLPSLRLEIKSFLILFFLKKILKNQLLFLNRSIHCCGYRYPYVSSEIIFYKQPNPTRLQYLSLEPLVLDIQQNNGQIIEKIPIALKSKKKHYQRQMNAMYLILNQVVYYNHHVVNDANLNVIIL